MTDVGQNEPTYSVSEIVSEVSQLLHARFPTVWIEGEISGFRQPRGGHWYFDLKDDSAVLRCAMFRGTNSRVRFEVNDGLLVRIRAELSIYEVRGQFQAIVQQMELAGEGALRAAFDQLRNDLQNEGLFREEHKKRLPRFPRRIAVISSPVADASRDVFTVVARRYPVAEIVLVPTLVQGPGSEAGVLSALDELDSLTPQPDLAIVTRGGGSIEDLWTFNLESVARKIYDCEIPVISAIGHEMDFTIADMVADVRAATPTAAGELATPDRAELQARLDSIDGSLLTNISNRLSRLKLELANSKDRLQDPRTAISRRSQRIDELEERLRKGIQLCLQHHEDTTRGAERIIRNLIPNLDHRFETISGLNARFETSIASLLGLLTDRVEGLDARVRSGSPLQTVDDRTVLVDSYYERLCRSMEDVLDRLNSNYQATRRTLEAASPRPTLQRGYAVLTHADETPIGRVITSVDDVSEGDKVRVLVKDGRIEGAVTGVEKGEPLPSSR